MPLLLSKKISTDSAYAIWKISETKWVLDELIDEQPPKELINQTKRSEWIVTRILVRYLCSGFDIPYQGVSNHETGKPFLLGHDAEISISHSFPMAGAMIHLKKPCGIDLEWPRKKLIRIQNKFLHDSELIYKDNIESLCRIWMCKEVLFKIHGTKLLSFKDEMKVEIDDDWNATGSILKEGCEQTHNVQIEPVFDYLMAYNT